MVTLSDYRIVGAEALVRRVEGKKIISPSDFIPDAERTGKIISIGQWVLADVCRQINEWQGSGVEPVPIAINISARELFHTNFTENVLEVVKAAKVDPKLIKFELTETFPVEELERADKILKQLKKQGFTLLIDDFGTGYASLKYLTYLPFDGVKIDQTFVATLPDSLPDAAIISAVCGLARQLKLRVIAEGVDKKSQLNFLRAVGCNSAQGNYFCKAVSAEALTKLLQGKRKLPA